MKGGRPFFPERPEVFFVVVALRQSSKFREQRRERSFLTFTERAMCRGDCRSNAERSCGGYLACDLDRSIELLSGRGHVLNESHSVGPLAIPFFPRPPVRHFILPPPLP